MEEFTIRDILREGLTNRSSCSLGELATGNPPRYEPHCTSQKCIGSSSWSPVRKYLGSLKPDICPDCGNYLLYKKVTK